MRKQCILMVPALAIGLCAPFTPVPLNAQSENAAQKFQQLALTPDQKGQLIPILVAEAPKVKAIKADSSLTPISEVAAAQGRSWADGPSSEGPFSVGSDTPRAPDNSSPGVTARHRAKTESVKGGLLRGMKSATLRGDRPK